MFSPSQALRRSSRHTQSQSQSGTYQTRSRSQTHGNARAPPDLNTTRSITSKVGIRGRAKNEAETELVDIERKTKKAKTQKESLDEKASDAEVELRKILQSAGMATNESDARKVAEERIRANTNKNGTMQVHSLFVPSFEAMDMDMRGGTMRGLMSSASRKSDNRKLPFDHPAALPGQQFGREALSKEQFAKKEADYQRRGGTGDIIGFSNQYRSQASEKRYKIQKERGDGFAAHNEGKKLHLKKVIPNACIKRPEFLKMHDNNKGFDILPLTGPLKNAPLPRVLDLVAKLCKQPNWKHFHATLLGPPGELPKMIGTRLLENGKTLKTKNGKLPAEHASAGYRFVFADKDATFDS